MSITITRTFRLSGTLFDPTSVKLSDSTGTFGVKRNDTNAVIVADNTAMTKVSTGVYTYTWEEPAASLSYTYSVEYVYLSVTSYAVYTVDGSSPAGTTVLTNSFADLYGEVLKFLAITNPTADDTTLAKKYVNEGYRAFLMGLDPRTGRAYQWSFLFPHASITLWPTLAAGTITATGTYAASTTTVTASAAAFYPSMVGKTITIADVGDLTVAGYTSSTVVTVAGDHHWTGSKALSITADGRYTLPDDFGSLLDELAYPSNGPAIVAQQRPSEYVARMYAGSGTTTGWPRFYAIEPVAFAGAQQRYCLYVWPYCSSPYAFTYRYRVNSAALSADTDLPLGGMMHAQTILEAAKAAAELGSNDTIGIHAARFKELMAASIDLDARNKPAIIPSTDNSDAEYGSVRRRRNNVTYN